MSAPLRPMYGSPIYLPDFFKLLSLDEFWSPFLSWSFITLVLPLGMAYAINFPSVVSGGHNPRRQAQFHGRNFDPITFSVTKALLIFAVFYRACPIIPGDSSYTISKAVGGEVMLLTATVGFVYALYDAILAHH
jgi:hypothetical protein